MKRISFLLLFTVLLNAESLNYYFFSIKENYKEYNSGNVIDRDYSSFGEINGIGVKYTKNYYYSQIYLKAEGSYGTSTYDGAYQDGTPVKFHQNDVQIYNFNAGFYSRPYLLEIGYRFWNRGDSGEEGDYNEQYYWPYFAIGMKYFLNFNSFSINYYLKYNYAFSPKLKVYLGNNPTIDLGDTTGVETQISYTKKFNYEYTLGIFYRFSYWHINRSKTVTINYNGNNYQLFEPESETRNQYIGIFLEKSF